MKNVIQFPAIRNEAQKDNVNYSDFLVNSQNYKNVSHLPNKRSYVPGDSSQLYSTYNTLIANKLTQKESYNNKELEKSNLAFIMLSSFSILLYIFLVLKGITNAKEMCQYALSPLLKSSAIVISFFGTLFTLYYALKIAKNIHRSNKVIDRKQASLLVLSFFYTLAFALTPLCLFAFNIACKK